MVATNEVPGVAVSLADICQSEEDFVDKISQNAHIEREHARTICNTLRTLALDSDSTGVWPHFAIPVLTLVPPNAPLPESGVLKQTYDLTCASNTFATRRSIGSMLAGPGSESDDFADVGFWCGKIDEADKEASLLHTLSLSSWIYTGTISRLGQAPLTTLRKSEMWEMLTTLKDHIEFRVQRPDSGGRVMHIVAGKGSEGWCGMIGVGVWSDIDE